MPRNIAITNLNATTTDIINTIRANASLEYQSNVPKVNTEHDIPRVGEVLFGYPALANEFLSALLNRIALVRIRSAVYNNRFIQFKKGYLEFGETIEEVFVNIAKVREFNTEKAEARELKRTLPDVRAAFHAINWKVQYPVTIENNELRQAFTSFTGVEDMIARIVNAVYTAAEYDEFLLFKYLIIKAVAHGNMANVNYDGTNIKDAATQFRGVSNMLTFMGNKYNREGVTTTTPVSDQYIIMDSMYNAKYGVDILSAAFNKEYVDYSQRVVLVDSWTTFDNERWAEIRENTDMVEEVTADELEAMENVRAIVIDKEWFQFYDNLTQFSEKFVASGLYWNYFLNVWKTVSTSPFSNAIAFIDTTTAVTMPATIKLKVEQIVRSDSNVIITFATPIADGTNQYFYQFIQNQNATSMGIAVHRYGAYILTKDVTALPVEFTINGTQYLPAAAVNTANLEVGSEITFNKQ